MKEKEYDFNKKRITRVTIVTAFMTTFMSSALNLSIPNIGADFNVTAGAVGWIVTIYTLSVAAFCVPMGKIADMTGKARMIKIGLAGFAVLTFLCMAVNSITMFIIIRALQGIAASMIFATNNPIIIEAYPPQERGRALGISVAATYVGLSAGPVIGGIINHNLGWHFIFIISGIVSVAGLVLAVKALPEDEHDEKSSFRNMDISGIILYIPMIVALLYGISLVGSGWLAYLLIAVAIILMIIFYKNEQRSKLPIISFRLFEKDRELTFSNLAALLNYGATFAISYLISIYLQIAIGLNSQTAGLVLVIMPLLQAIFSPYMGRMSDRIAPYKLATAGMLCCIATLTLFIATLDTFKVPYVICALAIGGVGFALFSSPNTNAINSRIPPRDRGQGNAILSTMRTVGQSLSMCIVTVIVNLRLGSETLQATSVENLVATIRVCFIVFAVLCVLGTYFSAARSKKQK